MLFNNNNKTALKDYYFSMDDMDDILHVKDKDGNIYPLFIDISDKTLYAMKNDDTYHN